jgi:hypothetical protein
MTRTLKTLLVVLALTMPANARDFDTEDGARKSATEHFDALAVECPKLKATLPPMEYSKPPYTCEDFTLPFQATKQFLIGQPTKNYGLKC